MRKSLRIAAFAAAVFGILISSVLAGDKYTWASAHDGDWGTAANWSPNTGTPGLATGGLDSITLAQGKYTITLDQDRSIMSIGRPESGAPCVNLNGHTLTITAASGGSAVSCIDGISTGDYFGPRSKEEVFINGHVNVTLGTFLLGGNGSSSSGGLIVSNQCLLESPVTFNCNSRLIIADGSTWKPNGGVNLTWSTKYTFGSYIQVTGENSKIISPNGNLKLRFCNNGLYVEDGAVAELSSVIFDGSNGDAERICYSNRVVIADGELYCRGNFETGSSGNNNFINYDNYVEISGEHAFLCVTNANKSIKLFDSEAPHFSFVVPAYGFKDRENVPRAPIQANKMEFVSLSESFYNAGPLKLDLDIDLFASAHPDGARCEIIRLTEANAALLDSLAARATFPGFVRTLYTADAYLETETEGADAGKVLYLVTPSHQTEATPPQFDPFSVEDSVVGNHIVSVDILSYGALSAMASVQLTYSLNSDFTDAVVTNLADSVSNIAPCSYSWTLTGFPQHRLYYAKMKLTNENGKEAEAQFTFYTNGPEETMTWKNALDGNFEDLSKWNSTIMPVDSCPHKEDTVTMASAGNYTITLNADHEIKRFSGGMDNGGGQTSWRRYTFDLNGHSLKCVDPTPNSVIFLAGGNPDAPDLLPCRTTLEFRNGILEQ